MVECNVCKKEFEEEKKQKRIDNHTKQQWGLNKKKNDGVKYVGSRQYLYDDKTEPLSTPKTPEVKPIELPPLRVTPVDTQSLNQRLRNTKIAGGLTPELLGLQKQINKNIDYVLGTDDQKDESRNNETNNKEEN